MATLAQYANAAGVAFSAPTGAILRQSTGCRGGGASALVSNDFLCEGCAGNGSTQVAAKMAGLVSAAAQCLTLFELEPDFGYQYFSSRDDALTRKVVPCPM